MLHKYISDVKDLRAQLKAQNKEYILASELPALKVYLQVEGVFAGEQVVWNMCIRTIEEYSKDHQITNDPQQFIKIEQKDDAYHIEVGLNVKLIDRPVVERTIIMVRKYKRLYLGRHEYGARSKILCIKIP